MEKEIIGKTTVKPLTVESLKRKMRGIASIHNRNTEYGITDGKLSDALVCNYEETKFLLELLGEKI